jgi:hypothetical protein
MRTTKKNIENVFRNSDSPDELFDNFRIAIDQKIKDNKLFRVLLWNKALSPDEIMMFAEKICRENPDWSYNIYNWVGKIFSSLSLFGELNEKAFKYFQKAADSKPESHEPYISIIKMYNPEIDIPRLNLIIRSAEKGLNTVNEKSKLCFSLSRLYKSAGDSEKEKYYQRLGENYQKEGK